MPIVTPIPLLLKVARSMPHQISGPDLTRATDMHCRGLLVFGQSAHRSGGRPHAPRSISVLE